MTICPTDVEPLYSALGGDPDLGDLVDMFVDEMPGRVATILAQLNAGDWESLRRTAHQFKGAAGSYGFEGVSPCAAALEAAIRTGADEQQIRDAVDLLVSMCGRMRAGTPADA